MADTWQVFLSEQFGFCRTDTAEIAEELADPDSDYKTISVVRGSALPTDRDGGLRLPGTWTSRDLYELSLDDYETPQERSEAWKLACAAAWGMSNPDASEELLRLRTELQGARDELHLRYAELEAARQIAAKRGAELARLQGERDAAQRVAIDHFERYKWASTEADRLLPVVEAVGKWAAWHKGIAPEGTMFIPEDELHLAYARLGSHWREAAPGETPGQVLPGEDDPGLVPAVDASSAAAPADGAGESHYLTPVLDSLAKQLPDCEPELIRFYALLAFAVGMDVTREHVHDAWAIWQAQTDPGHRSLVPFAELPEDVQALDAPYAAAIRIAALEVDRGLGEAQEGIEGELRDVHGWFSLSYSNFLVLHRSLMQSMPAQWQHRMVTCLDEISAAYAHLKHPSFRVTTGKWCYIDDLSEAELKAAGVSWCCNGSQTEESSDELGDEDHDCTYYDSDGDELTRATACVFIESADPIPLYNRGRTHVPRADELEPGLVVVTPPDVAVPSTPGKEADRG